jgi:hypothetical protein
MNMFKIWKYDLPDSGVRRIDVPTGSVPLSVGTQDDKVFAWIRVTESSDPEVCEFRVMTTGSCYPSREYPETFLGTVQMKEDNGDPYVVHVFWSTI